MDNNDMDKLHDNLSICCNMDKDMYEHCDFCLKCVSIDYIHCRRCKTCHYRYYKYCKECNRCYDNGYKKHCKDCSKCHNKRKCGESINTISTNTINENINTIFCPWCKISINSMLMYHNWKLNLCVKFC